MPVALPASISAYLRRVVVRARRREMFVALLWSAAALGAWGLAACAIDRFFHLTADQRIGMLGAGAAITVGVLLWPVRNWGRAVDWIAVAALVEGHRPGFGQRLVTITSRLLGPGEHLGSQAMIARLLAEVERQIADDPSPVSASAARRLAWPIAACAAVAIAAAAMLQVPGVQLPQLTMRFALPWRPTPPVTTTRLTIRPDGDSQISGTQPPELHIDVDADRLGDGVVSIFMQPADEPGVAWSRLTMDQLSPGRFEYVLAGIDRDLRYYIAGGDAVSRVYSVRLLRRPAVSEFRIRYRYPAFVRRSEATVMNTDGRIEAPAGTQAELTITATEPLRSATLRIGSALLPMAPTSDPLEFTATIPVTVDQSYLLEMISTRQVAGAGPAEPGAMRIRAIPNRPPMLRLTDASGEPGAVLSVDPRQVLPVAFEAEDDFGITGLWLRWRIDDGQAGRHERRGESAVAIPDGVRHIEDAVDFDLASLPLRVGDVLKVWLEVRNTAGQKAVSQPIEALMSARPVDGQMRQRLAALDAAAGFADRLAGHVGDANAQASGSQSEAISAALSSATEDAGLLRQSLLRVIAHGAPRTSAVALAGWVDSATQQSYWADRLFQQLGDQNTLDAAGRAKLGELANAARTLHDQLLIVDQGQWAEAALAELENVKNANQAGGVLAWVRQDAADDAKNAGCNQGPDESALKSKLDAATAALASAAPIDLLPPAQQWAQEILADPQTHPSLSPRLRSAAEAEALQQQGDLPEARDLELSSRSAEALETFAQKHPPGSAAVSRELTSFVSALSAFAQEWQFNSHAKANDTEPAAMRQAAAAARQQMEQWLKSTEESPAPVASRSRASARSAEASALDAAAQSAGHHASAATRPGSSLATLPTMPIPSASAARIRSNTTANQKLATAQQLDSIGQRQEELLRQTSKALPAEAPTLAQRQQQVADSIATVAAGHEPAAIAGDDGGERGEGGLNWRQREAAALMAIGQQLAEMPQQLAMAQEAIAGAVAAIAHADAAKIELDRVSALPKNPAAAGLVQAAQRSAAQSTADAGDAEHRLAQLTGPVSAASARRMADELAPFSPEASAAQSAISDQLQPALANFERAARAHDAAAADSAAAAARNGIAVALRALADAQNALADRDPLVTASSSARAAVESLRRSPPDFSTAVRHQTQVTLSLSRAWDQSIHTAAAQRLAAVPGLQPIFSAGSGPLVAGSGNGVAPLAEQVAQGRQWGRLQGQGNDASPAATAGGNADPPGFEDALRLYFQALGKAQKEGK